MKNRIVLNLLIIVALFGVVSSCASDSDSDIKEWFKDLSWTEDTVKFTTAKGMTIIGISVFVDDIEYKTISMDTVGYVKFQNGTVLTGTGTGLNFNFAGEMTFGSNASAVCRFDINGAKPTEICIYLKDGEVLTKKI